MLAIIRGAGDIASGIAVRLWRSGFEVIMTEVDKPTSIRREVCFSQAVVNGEAAVEDVLAYLAASPDEALNTVRSGKIAVIVDKDADIVKELRPEVLIDAILAKRNLGTRMTDAPVVIGIGPGFCAGRDCHAVVETMRGHYLGRAIYKGEALANTGVPGTLGGYAAERVVRSPADGVFRLSRDIGSKVVAGEAVGEVSGLDVISVIGGVLRGIIADGTPVYKGMKIGDVDPRGVGEYCGLVSDKALAVAGGVLEAILRLRRPAMPDGSKIIAACGNDCGKCPRHMPKTKEQLDKTARLWKEIGYRDTVETASDIACNGCDPANVCRYKIVGCAAENGVPNCGACSKYPCENIEACFSATMAFEPACRAACNDEEYETLRRAFFEKRENLDAYRMSLGR